MSAELQNQLQQQLAVMQQQFAAEKQQMTERMQRMVQENQQLQQLRAQASASSSPPAQTPASSSSSIPTPRIDIRLMQPASFHGTASSNAMQWLMEVERYFLATNLVSSSSESSRMRIMLRI
jgi:hypothetical protein